MVSQVFPSPYDVANDSSPVLDAYGMTAFDPPSTEYDYLTSILEFVSSVSKTMDTASITVAAVPVTIYKSSYHLPTASITVSSVPLASLGIGTILSTAEITVGAESVEVNRGPVTLATPTITIEAIPVTAAVSVLIIDLVTAEITIESEEVAPGLAFYAETAEIAVEAEPVDAELGPFILETAEIFVGAEAVRLPFILPTTDISVEAVPGHTGEVKVLTTADITIGAEPVSALAFIAIEMNFDLPPPIIYVYGQGQSPVDGPPDPGDDWIEIYAGAEIPAISKLVCHVRAVYQVIDRVS